MIGAGEFSRRSQPLDSMSAKGKMYNRGPQNVTRLRKVESLERLKERVEAAADEIVRLRGENARMSTDISQLRSAVTEAEKKPALDFDESPEALRARVRGFIAAIDDYLQTEA